MRKEVLICLVIVFLMVFVSCEDSSNGEQGNTAMVKISAMQGGGNRNRSVYGSSPYDVDDSMMKPEVLGDPAYSVTPSAFILDINDVTLFNPVYPDDITRERAKDKLDLLEAYSYGVPKRFNMMNTKNMSTISMKMADVKRDWHGMAINIRPGGNETTNGFWAGSIIGIKKDSFPFDYTLVTNYMYSAPFDIELSDEYLWFSFQDIIPFNSSGMMGCITFSDSVTGVKLINPEGESGTAWNYGLEFCQGNQTGCVLPMQSINIGSFQNPEISITVDTKDMIQFYSDGEGHYKAFLNKANPFPFNLIVEEYDDSVQFYEGQSVSDISQATPIDCFDYHRTSNGEKQRIMTYTNGNYSGFDHVEIYRSSDAVFDEGDVLVYTGNAIVYIEQEDVPDSCSYFVRAVDSDGNKSDAKIFMPIITEFIPFE